MKHIHRRSGSEYVVTTEFSDEDDGEVLGTIADAVIYACGGPAGDDVTFSPAAAEELATLARIAKSVTAVER